MMAPTRGQRRAVILLLLLSVVLITLDHRGEAFRGIRSAAHSVVDPAQQGVTTLVAPVGRFFGGLGDLGDSGRQIDALQQENAELRRQLRESELSVTRSDELQRLKLLSGAGRVHRAARDRHRARPGDRLRVDGHRGRRPPGRPAAGPDRDRLRRAGRPGQAGRRELGGGGARGRPGLGGRRPGRRRQRARRRRRQRPRPAHVHAAGPGDQGAGRRPAAHRPVRRVHVRGRAAGRRGDRGVRRPGRAGPGGDRHPVRVVRPPRPGRDRARRAAGRPARPARRRRRRRPPPRSTRREGRPGRRRRAGDRRRGDPAGRRAVPAAAARAARRTSCSCSSSRSAWPPAAAPVSPPASAPGCSPTCSPTTRSACWRCASRWPASSPACSRPTSERSVLLPVVVVAVATGAVDLTYLAVLGLLGRTVADGAGGVPGTFATTSCSRRSSSRWSGGDQALRPGEARTASGAGCEQPSAVTR